MSRLSLLPGIASLVFAAVAAGQTAGSSPVATGYTPPKVLTRGVVAYPELARLNRIEGVVRLKFSIDDTGHVSDATVVSGGSNHSVILDYVARERGVREWVFQPATLHGAPVPSTYEQEFEFRLDPAQERQSALTRIAAPIGFPDPPYPTEAAAARLSGQVTIGVRWTSSGAHPGLVDSISLIKSSGSTLLDVTALRFAYEHWRIDPSKVSAEVFTKTVDFRPPQ